MFVLSSLAMLAASVSHDAVPVELLIGKPGLKRASVVRAIRGVAKLVEKDASGLFRIRMLPGVDRREGQNLIASRGVYLQFDVAATHVDPNSLPSVSAHIGYLKGVAKLQPGADEEEAADFYEALKAYLEPRVDKTGKLPHQAYIDAAAHRDQMPSPPDQVVGSWSHQGPLNMDVPYQTYYGVPPLSGRKNDIAYAPTNPNTIYTASAGGGIWKSTDGGSTWAPKSDGWPYLHTSSVAVSPTNENLVLAGTGDYVGFFTAQTFGIMRSTDGGATWTNVGNADFGTKIVSKILFDPTQPNVVLASTGRGGSATGDIWRSTDAGLTWARTNAIDGNWDDLDVAYLEETPGMRRMWGIGGGSTRIAYSIDHGANWVPVATPALLSTTEPLTNIAASRADADGVYVVGPTNNKVLRSNDGGATWTDITGPSMTWSQDTYNLHVTVGGNTPSGTRAQGSRPIDVVYVGLITVYATDDGGATWVDIAGTATATSKWHNDQHCMTPHPTLSHQGMVGGDGGLAKFTYDPTTNSATFTPINQTISDEQFYAIAVHPTDFNYVMGGTQDNASPASRGNLAAWDNLYAGDGCFCGFNRSTPGVHYTTSQSGSVYRYDTPLDTTATSISPGGSAPFVTPLAMGNTNYTDPFTTTGNLLRRYNGSAWVASTTTLSSNASQICVSRTNGQRIFTVHGNGDVYMSNDNGVTLTKIDGDLPNVAVGAVYESPYAAFDVVAVLKTTSGSVGRAYRCTNVNVPSPAWVDISGSGATALPKIPFNTVVWDPYGSAILYAGSDIGCFMSTNLGATWSNMNTLGLPNVHVNQLVVSNGNQWLYAGTYGRGIWRIALGP